MKRTQVGWGLWLWWVLACIVGQQLWWVLDWIVGQAVGGGVSGLAWPLAAFAFSVGIPQWFVLRRYVSRAGWWVLAIFVGFGVGAGVNLVVGPAVAATEDWTVALSVGVVAMALRWAIHGSSVGIAQWFVLRHYVSRAGWWVLASIVGFSVAFTVGVVAVVVGGVHGTGRTPEEAHAMAVVLTGLVEGLVAGAVYGAITGGALVWLLRQPISEAQKGSKSMG